MNHGPLRFARYAFPPNDYGYCGPDASTTLLEYADQRIVDGGLRMLSEDFTGAWPYLELIARSSGRADPLDDAVVSAYWLGNDLLRSVSVQEMGDMVEHRFRLRAGLDWSRLAEPLQAGPVPHHSFHVFGVYPWVGLLRAGPSEEPLRVLDRCRVSTGIVESISGDTANVTRRPLVWDGLRLGFGSTALEPVRMSREQRSLAKGVAPGSVVTLHWDWICEVVTGASASRIEAWTASQLDLVNQVRHPAPVQVLG